MGNVIVAWKTHWNSANEWDVAIVKYSSAGVKQWEFAGRGETMATTFRLRYMSILTA